MSGDQHIVKPDFAVLAQEFMSQSPHTPFGAVASDGIACFFCRGKANPNVVWGLRVLPRLHHKGRSRRVTSVPNIQKFGAVFQSAQRCGLERHGVGWELYRKLGGPAHHLRRALKRLKLTVSCGLWRGVWPEFGVRFLWPCAPGNRGGACELERKAGMYVSSLSRY